MKAGLQCLINNNKLSSVAHVYYRNSNANKPNDLISNENQVKQFFDRDYHKDQLDLEPSTSTKFKNQKPIEPEKQ